MTIKFRKEIGNDEYIIICSFGGRRMSGLVVRLISTDAAFLATDVNARKF